MNLRSVWNRVLGFKVLLTGTDTAVRLRLTDGDSRVFYLDAADKDYKTAAVITPVHSNDLTTGLSVIPYDSVGVAAAAAQHSPMPVVKNPIEVAIINGGTAGDIIDFTLDYECDVFGAETFTMPTAASSASTKVVSLRSKYAQVLGFKALSVGTSTTQALQIKDADNKIVYLDAAAKDYDTAALDKILIIDATVTNLTGVVPRDSTGAAIQAGVGRIEPPLVRSPLTVDLTLSEGNDEVVTMTIYYKRG
jgi:hypothetical protein